MSCYKRSAGQQLAALSPLFSSASPSLEVALKMLLTLTPESCQCPGTPRRTSNKTKSGKTLCITLFSDGFHFPLK